MTWNTTILGAPAQEKQGKHPSPASEPSDSVLFEKFLEGDDAPLVSLFDRHNHRLYLYCVQFVRDPQKAEDVTQELWERVIRLRAEGRATAQNPLGLLLTIARNLCLDEIRKDRHHSPLHDLPEISHPIVTTFDAAYASAA